MKVHRVPVRIWRTELPNPVAVRGGVLGPSGRASQVAIGISLVVLGSAFSFGFLTRAGETTYDVAIDAPYGVAWTLWIPRPRTPMEVHSSLPGIVIPGVIETLYGEMDLISGSGPLELSYTLRWTVLRVTPLEPEGFVDLTAHDGNGFRVYRMSSDPGEGVSIQTDTSVRGQQGSGRFACRTWSFGGTLAEGWNLLPYGLGDCVVLTADPLPFVAASSAMVAVGAVLLVRAGVRLLRPRTAS